MNRILDKRIISVILSVCVFFAALIFFFGTAPRICLGAESGAGNNVYHDTGAGIEPGAGVESVKAGSAVSLSGLGDGIYTMQVTLSNAPIGWEITSPCRFQIKGQTATALIEWESDRYEYMIAEGLKIEPEKREGGSKFKVPIPLSGEGLEVTAVKKEFGLTSQSVCVLSFDLSTIEKASPAVSKNYAMASAGFSFFAIISIATMVLVLLHRKIVKGEL